MADEVNELKQTVASLVKTVEQLNKRLQVQEDEQAIRKLHHLYGYLIDKCMYNEVVDLFTDDCEVRFMGGIYRGREGAERLYVKRFQTRFTHGNNGPIDGWLLDHPMSQDIVDIDPDGKTAKARFRCNMMAGQHKDFGTPRQWWEGALYENTYRKVDGVWRIEVLNYVPQWHADFETGWAHTRYNFVPFLAETVSDEKPLGPDELYTDRWLWPTHKVVPFHMNHPVTGKPMIAERWQGDIDRENKR